MTLQHGSYDNLMTHLQPLPDRLSGASTYSITYQKVGKYWKKVRYHIPPLTLSATEANLQSQAISYLCYYYSHCPTKWRLHLSDHLPKSGKTLKKHKIVPLSLHKKYRHLHGPPLTLRIFFLRNLQIWCLFMIYKNIAREKCLFFEKTLCLLWSVLT